MTKKDYTKVAENLKGSKPSDDTLLRYWRKSIEGMCSVFQRDNPRFDPIRFKTACGY